MAQFARPDSDVAFGILGATPINTAGNRYQNIDESTPSDTDYVYSQNNPGGGSGAEFGLSDITDPGVNTGHILRIRSAQIDEDSGPHPMGADATGTATALAWELRQGGTVIQSGDISPGEFTTTTVNLTESNVANISDYTDLRVFLNPSGGAGPTANRRAVAVSWIELETPDAAVGGPVDLVGTSDGVASADSVVLISRGLVGTSAGAASSAAVLSTTGGQAPVWTTPADTASIGTTPTLAFIMPDLGAAMHFEMHLDTADTFDTGSLREYRSNVSQSGWEFWDGDSWEPVPAGGVDNSFAGNEARFTVPTALTSTTWFRRVRAGV